MCMYVSRASLRRQETDFVKIAYVKYQCNIINNHILLLIFIRLLLEGGEEGEREWVYCLILSLKWFSVFISLIVLSQYLMINVFHELQCFIDQINDNRTQYHSV